MSGAGSEEGREGYRLAENAKDQGPRSAAHPGTQAELHSGSVAEHRPAPSFPTRFNPLLCHATVAISHHTTQ